MRAGTVAAAAVLAAWVAGCGTSPPVQLYRLPGTPPTTAAPAAAQAPAAVPGVESVQLLTPVRVPEYLDREALLLPQGQSGVLALSGHRWAEPLRDAVPRVLRDDLTRLLGANRLWSSPLPAGVQPARTVRVELTAFEATPDHRAVRLAARWTIADPTGRTPPRTDAAELQAVAASADPDALVVAHRAALWQLAERLAAALR